jgi:DUF4097 and DUF4098 domain-containing protein YvlB
MVVEGTIPGKFSYNQKKAQKIHQKEKTMRKKILAVFIPSFLIFFAIFQTASAKEIDKDFHQSFEVKEGNALRLRHGDGDVLVIPWEQNIIDVKVRYRADVDVFGIRIGSRHEFDVEFRQTEDNVYVTGKEVSGGAIGFQNINIHEYVYEIHSPAYIKLDLDGDDGDVDIKDWKAEIDCQIDDGDIKLTNILAEKTTIWGEDGDVEINSLAGDLTVGLDDGDIFLTDCQTEPCRLKAEDGDIIIQESAGSFNITVDDGDVNLNQIRAKALDIESEDGDIELDLLAVSEMDADIRTDDGSVRVDLEKGFSLAFYAFSDDKDNIQIKIDDIQNFKEDSQSKSGQIHGGKGRLKIRTADGGITIRENF